MGTVRGGEKGGLNVLSVYSGSTGRETIVYEHGLDGALTGSVQVRVDESANQLEVVAILLRIAALIEKEHGQSPNQGVKTACRSKGSHADPLPPSE
jgi:hypothetical protein